MSDTPGQQSSSTQPAPESKAGPHLDFDLSTKVEQLRRERLREKTIASKTLVKHPDFRIALTVMKAGARIEEHKAVGRISVQTVSGHIRMQVPGRVVDLPAGSMLALDRAVPHDVEAIGDSAFLLTMTIPESTEPAKSGLMPQTFALQPVGFVSSQYKDTAEVPKGLGAKHVAEGVLQILPEFEAGLTDIEGFSHLCVIWLFDRTQGFELMATPASDNRPHGVFATRSPKRPNAIGLTVVELLRREGRMLHARGIDMIDGTPILDIKPYLSSIPEQALRRGWLAEAEARKT